MKYNININQRAIVEMGFDLDLVDAAIIDFIHSWVVQGGILKKDFYDNTYYWLDYKYMAKEMPLLGIKSKDGVYRRLKKICNQGILIPHPHNQASGKPYFAFGPKFKHLLFKNASDENPNAPYQGNKRPDKTVNKSEPSSDESLHYNNITDNIIKDNKIVLPFPSDMFKTVWDNWIADRKERGKKVTKRAAQMQFKILSKYSEDVAIRMVNQAIERNWQTFYELKNDEKVILSLHENEMKGIFQKFYLEQTSISYEWKKEDDFGISKLSATFRLRIIQKAMRLNEVPPGEGHELDYQTSNSFSQFLNILNDFHRKRFLTPPLLYKNFNIIISELSHANKLNTTATTASDYV